MPKTEAPPISTSELLSLAEHPTLDLNIGNRALRVTDRTGYRMAAEGRYPCTVLRVRGQWRVVTSSLLQVLGIERVTGAA